MKYYKMLLLSMCVLLFLGACSASLEESVAEAKPAVEAALNENPKKSNKENEFIQYNIPFWYEIQDETLNNILLKNGNKKYILFYNQQEGTNSEVVFNATTQQKDYDVIEVFKTTDKFGYFLVKELSDKLYEVTVGIGGVKITGEMKESSIKSEATMMMKIVNSVRGR